MERIKRYTIKLLTVFTAFIFLLSLVALFVLNSGVIDLLVKERATALFNENFVGRLELGELHLKFPNSVTLINPRIYSPGEAVPALEARKVSAKVNFLTFLQPEIRKLYLRRLVADSLNARVIEQENGKLNIEQLFAFRDPNIKQAPLDHFFSKKLQLKNSTLTYTGKKSNPNALQLSVNHINLELTSFTIKEKFLKGKLDTLRLRLTLPRENITLHQASGSFLFSENRAEIIALKAEANKSKAELSATFDNFTIFSSLIQKQLLRADSFLNIQELSLQSSDLKPFFPALLLPDGMYTLKGNAKGKKDNVKILDANLTHLKNRIIVKGELLNLQNRNALAYQLECDSSRIEGAFIESLLQKSTYREIAKKTGNITFLGRVKGNLKTVKSELTLRTAPGDLSLNAETSKEGSEQFSSKGTMVLKNLKPQKLVDAGGEKSLINASGSFEGVMVNKKINRLKLDLKLADSYWQNQPIKEGSMLLDFGNDMLAATVSLKNNLTTFSLDGGVDLKDKATRYQASGKATALDLSKILGSEQYKTDLNGTFSMNGSGVDAKALNVFAMMKFAPSQINNIRLKENSKASVEIVQKPGSSRTTINSDFFDLLTEGNFSFDELIALGRLAGSGIAREIASQNIWQSTMPAPENSSGKLTKPFTVNYLVTIKDLSPFQRLFPVEALSVKGRAEGRALYSNGECSIESAIRVEQLKAKNSVLIEKLAMAAGVECTASGTKKASVNAKAASLSLAGKKTGAAIFTALYTPSRLETTLDISTLEPKQNFSAKLSAAKSGSSYDLTVNHLSLKDAEGIWQASEKSHIMLGRTSALFNRFSLMKGGQQIVLNGELSNSQSGTFQCILYKVQLRELRQLAINPSLDLLAGTINASLTVSGTPGAKTTALKLNGEDIRYDKIRIGTVQGTARHSSGQLQFEMHNSSPGSLNSAKPIVVMNTFEGSGTIPLELSYYPLHFRTAPQQPIRVSFRSDNLSAQLLKYIVPIVDDAEGIIPTTLKIEGRTPTPDIYLTSRLLDTKIRIEPTQVTYLLNGELFITPKAIELRDIKIRDNLKGTGRINGVVKLDKLEPGALALECRIDNLLLFNKKDRKDETSFGTITGSTNNLLLHGTFTSPLAEGELRINAADFSLYRAGANESAKYIGVNKFIEFVPRYPSQSSAEIAGSNAAVQPAEFYYSLLDILQIKNLRLTSNVPIKCSVIFDRLRGEQIETTVNNLSLVVNKTDQLYRLFGSVNVIGGKYKFSNSNFDLQDGGKVAWNNADIRGGVMDNLYGAKYVTAVNQQTAERDNVKLLLAITGSLNEPQVEMGYYLNEQSQPFSSRNTIGGQSSQIDPNAQLNVITMLLSKQWYIRPGSSSQNTGFASNVGISTGTGMISSQLSRVVQDIAGIESFNVNVGVDNRGALSGLDLYFALNVPGTGGKVRFVGTGSSPSMKQSVMSDYYGTAQKIEYRVTPKIYLEAYRSYGQTGNETSSINLQKPSETWGASVSYRERFNSWDQFWKRIIPSSGKKK
ncbi:translocation/assembly module TamB [Chlorobium sp. KB01]|uniref:translocation/assembly module TamB domain-containing protein n=1 Tax=Chlorobium sp. KB01 TaxID=1917528 RepID=UPI000975A70C|nr:translocation/assembly module TamB [Chlorobium sp. KB01]